MPQDQTIQEVGTVRASKRKSIARAGAITLALTLHALIIHVLLLENGAIRMPAPPRVAPILATIVSEPRRLPPPPKLKVVVTQSQLIKPQITWPQKVVDVQIVVPDDVVAVRKSDAPLMLGAPASQGSGNASGHSATISVIHSVAPDY